MHTVMEVTYKGLYIQKEKSYLKGHLKRPLNVHVCLTLMQFEGHLEVNWAFSFDLHTPCVEDSFFFFKSTRGDALQVD